MVANFQPIGGFTRILYCRGCRRKVKVDHVDTMYCKACFKKVMAAQEES